VAAAEEGKKSFEKPYVGATFQPVTSEVAEALGLSTARGALIVGIVEGGPADKAGLKSGEVITAVNGIAVEHPDALWYRLTTAGLGQSVRLTVLQNGAERTVTMALGAAPETVPRDERLIEGRNPFAGLRVANLSPKLATELRLPADKVGVVVTEVVRGSPSARLGFQPGDIMVAVNGDPVPSTKAMEVLVDDNPGFWRVEIEREGQRIRQFFR
jgi:S1-C subfamily serine protease